MHMVDPDCRNDGSIRSQYTISDREENPSLHHDDERIESKEKDDALKITKNGKARYVTYSR